jgi:hypothetical protein
MVKVAAGCSDAGSSSDNSVCITGTCYGYAAISSITVAQEQAEPSTA